MFQAFWGGKCERAPQIRPDQERGIRYSRDISVDGRKKVRSWRCEIDSGWIPLMARGRKKGSFSLSFSRERESSAVLIIATGLGAISRPINHGRKEGRRERGDLQEMITTSESRPPHHRRQPFPVDRGAQLGGERERKKRKDEKAMRPQFQSPPFSTSWQRKIGDEVVGGGE